MTISIPPLLYPLLYPTLVSKVSIVHFQVLLPGGAHRPEPDGHHDDHQLERDELDTGDLVTLVTQAVVTRSAVSRWSGHRCQGARPGAADTQPGRTNVYSQMEILGF